MATVFPAIVTHTSRLLKFTNFSSPRERPLTSYSPNCFVMFLAFQIIISAITEVYTQAITSFLPTPSKSHYVFNLRDFARVVQVCVTSYTKQDAKVQKGTSLTFCNAKGCWSGEVPSLP